MMAAQAAVTGSAANPQAAKLCTIPLSVRSVNMVNQRNRGSGAIRPPSCVGFWRLGFARPRDQHLMLPLLAHRRSSAMPSQRDGRSCGIPPHGTTVKPTNLSDGGELIPDARPLRPGPP